MKYRNVKIEYNGNTIYSETLPGANKGKKCQYIRELMETADSLLPIGSRCILHYQQQNAKKWALYSYTTGETSAYVK